MLNRVTITLLIATLLLSMATVLLVVSGEVRLLTLIVHISALACGIAAFWYLPSSSAKPGSDRWIERADLPLIGAVLLVQLISLLYMQTFPFHYVQDEFITGYTSYTLPSFTEIEWYRGYPGPGEWIAGFPVLYYALQKPFIELFGLSLETIRVSTWPYHLLSAALVYLIGKEFFRCRPWAVVATVLYVALAPNLYMAGYGMHNISSTFFFLAAFYAAVRMLRTDDRRWVIVSGLFGAMAYLTYTSSYLTLPLIGALTGLSAPFARGWRPLIRFGQVTFIALLGLVPFLTYAVAHDNYFTERGDQVNAVSSFYTSDDVANPTSELLDHILLNVQSLYTPGIGGVTDYWFGKQALFDWFTLGFLFAGIIIAALQGIRHRAALNLAIVATILMTFLFGMLLTLPAGGFHRTSLAFPAIAILIALTIRTIIDTVPYLQANARLQAVGTGVLMILIGLINISMLQTMVSEDEEVSGLTDSVPVTSYIGENIPVGSDIIISSFPNYHLERELIVRTGDEYHVRIEPFNDAIEHAGEVSIVLFQPSSDQLHRLEARYAEGTFIEQYEGHELRRHVIWVPDSVDSH
jgi:hypothetical protein